MRIVRRISELRSQVRSWRAQRLTVSFVPTMGNLHEGHLALVKVAREHGDRVVTSIFVNPTQFGAGEDYATYPQSLEADCAQLQALAVDAVFAPAVSEMYPAGSTACTQVDVPALSGILCGASRPGHFTGVATIVTKLFNVVQPDSAVFGRKDYQQLLVIRRLVAELDLPIQVIGVPTVREPDGLARSSRNAYLKPAQRVLAPELFRTLTALAQALREGESNFRLLEARGRRRLLHAGMCPEYVVIRRGADLCEPYPNDLELVVLAAAWLGEARLIDNVEVPLNRYD